MVVLKMSIILALLLTESCIDVQSLGFPIRESHSVVHDQMLQTLKSCFVERVSTVIATPDLVDRLHPTTWGSKSLSVVAIDTDFQTKNSHGHFPGPPTFILTADSGKTLEKTLRLLKSSMWWSIEGLLFIIEAPQLECKVVSETLNIAWKMNLLSSFHLCDHADEGVTLYTYNPYTNRAPHPWTEVENVKKSDERWTMYKQAIVQDRVICETLDFDRMKLMDGYQIRAVASPLRRLVNGTWIPEKDYDISTLMGKIAYRHAMHFSIVFAILNVTLVVHYDHQGYLRNGTAFGFMIEIKNGSYDMTLSGEYLHAGITCAYPVVQGDLRILTQPGKFLRPEEKISRFYSSEIVYLSCFILLITFLIMVFYMNRRCGSAALEILRLAFSSSILQPLSNISIRIYFFGVFQLIIILNATFQGHISAFLTKPERRNVETMLDLESRHYHIYVPVHAENALSVKHWTRLPNQYIHIVENSKCDQYILNDTSAACINSILVHLHPAEKYGLHIGSESIVRPYMTHWYRDDWPLSKKLDMLRLRLGTAGLFEHWDQEQMYRVLPKLLFKEAQETAVQYRPIKLNDLIFTLRFLAIGLTLSTIVFLFEMMPKKKVMLFLNKQGKLSRRKMRSCKRALQSNLDSPKSSCCSSLGLELPLLVIRQQSMVNRSPISNLKTMVIKADIHHIGTLSESDQKCPASTAHLEIPSTSRPNAESIVSYNIDDTGLSLSNSDVESIQLFD